MLLLLRSEATPFRWLIERKPERKLEEETGTDHGFPIFLLNRQVVLIGIGLPLLRAIRFTRPGASYDHRGDLPLKALLAEGEAPVGRIPTRGQFSLTKTGDGPRFRNTGAPVSAFWRLPGLPVRARQDVRWCAIC